MANLLVDGFDWFPSGQSAATRARLWAANSFYKVNTIAPEADVALGRFDFGEAIAWDYSQGTTDFFFSLMNGYVVPIGATPATGFIGFGMKIGDTQSPGAAAAIGFFDAVNNKFQFCVTFEANGVVKAWTGATTDPGGTFDGGSFLASSIAGVYQVNEYFHCEIKGTIGATGSIEVRINTVPVLQVAAGNTQFSTPAYYDSHFIGVRQNNDQVGTLKTWIDDLFANDTTGAQNNTWSGNLRVKTQFVVGNGATNNFSIGGSAPAATNWQSVLNSLLDDTKYVYSSTIGNAEFYTIDANLNAPLVRAVQARAAFRQDDATQRSAKMQLRIGTTIYPNAAQHFTNQTYTFYKARWEVNPATAVTFTGAEVNGLQAGFKVQS